MNIRRIFDRIAGFTGFSGFIILNHFAREAHGWKKSIYEKNSGKSMMTRLVNGQRERKESEIHTMKSKRDNQANEYAVPIDMPLGVKKKLLDVAGRLPEDKRPTFLRVVLREMQQAVYNHPRTLVYGALGWVLGEVLDRLLVFPVPLTGKVIRVTADMASHVLAAAGLVKGFMEDRKAISLGTQMHRAVEMGIREAMGAANV
jgi:hypothetical protein